jgi:general secretion pathway protein H
LTSAKHRGFGQSGFTLIEVITVVIVIGVIISFITLSTGQHADRVVEDEAKRLQALMVLAREDAVLRPVNFALEISKHGYRFVVPGENPGEWAAREGDAVFREREFPEVIRVSLEVDSEEVSLENKENPAHILFLSTGEVQPIFTLQLKSTEDDTLFSLYGDGVAKVALVKGELEDA